MSDPKNKLYYGDNLEVLRDYIPDQSVDLIYLDPPFNSRQDYNVLFAEKEGSRSASQITAFKDSWEWNLEAERAYQDVVERGGRVAEAMRAFRTLLGGCKCRVVGERGQRGTINPRSCRWLIVSALVITSSGAWAQQSAPPASDQKVNRSWEATAQLLKLQCASPPAFDQKSVAVFEQQAATGDAAAQCGLGDLYSDGHDLRQNNTQALLEHLSGQGQPRDYAQAVFWYRKAAEQGDAEAQSRLGEAFRLGQGVPQDYAQAVFWYRKAAEQGDALAQANLGTAYTTGQGVLQDYAQAALWDRKAAEQGLDVAQYNLGVLYDEGQGVSQDYVQTTFWYRKAAEQGYAKAQYNLGVSYVLGQGVPQDYAQAALWYRKAAEQGYAEAQVGLGSFEATQHDFAEAYFWIDLATAGKLDASDMERAVRLRDDDAVILTPAELSREQERVRKWLEAHQAKPQ